ncbi:MAG TPA: hypothetical protein VLH35_01130, partial [Candidatus Acidoferrales bacterium]|nr:hypothetical protein [Candidatus Acidoferrales bacterium]
GNRSSVVSHFVVPPCNGSDAGVVHSVQLMTEYWASQPNFLFVSASPYDPPFSDIKNFTVYTHRSFAVPVSVQVGVSIPIHLTITGGRSNTLYIHRVDVTKPDGSVSTSTLNTTTDRLGSATSSLSYPTNFPAGQSTGQIGNYTVAVRELSPLDSYRYSTVVQVYDTVTPTPTNSSTPDGGQGSNSNNTQTDNPTPDNSTSPGPTNDTSTLQTGTITPTPNPPDRRDNGKGNGNLPPNAHLTTTPPSQINHGQPLILSGDAIDPDGTIVGYTWTSDINGVVSTDWQLDTANLSPGTHHITFQAIDDDGAVSNNVEFDLTVNSTSGFDPLPYVGAATAGTAIAVSAGAAVWVHYDRLSSVKIKSKLNQKSSQQKQQEENQEKKDEKKNKKRANLVFSDFKIPSNIMKDTGYTAQFSIRNVGNSKATNVKVYALANHFFDFKDPPASFGDLSPGQTVNVTMPFMTNPEIRKNIYQLQFEVKSKQTPGKVKRCFLRGGRIAVLTDAEVPSVAEPVMNWLRENRYPFEEIHEAAHLMTQLYQYDLLIVSANHDMPSKWVQNLVTFVENGQSLLLLDKISTRDPQRLTEALGYVEEPNPVTYAQAALEICQQHPITNGLHIGEPIPLGPCVGNAA